MVETEGLHSAGIAESDFRKHVEATTPLGRIAQPADIATAAVFFASRTPAGSPARPSSWPAAPASNSTRAAYPRPGYIPLRHQQSHSRHAHH